jgi:hypothetical protein
LISYGYPSATIASLAIEVPQSAIELIFHFDGALAQAKSRVKSARCECVLVRDLAQTWCVRAVARRTRRVVGAQPACVWVERDQRAMLARRGAPS